MAKKSSTRPAEKAVQALLDLVAERGWRSVSLADVARHGGILLGDLHAEFRTKWDILAHYLDSLDAAQMTGDLPDPQTSVRDSLFEVMMRRFEAMRPHRQAVKAILADAAFDPYLWPGGIKRIMETAALMLEAAGVSTSGIRGRFKVKGVAGLYLSVLRTWLDDDTDGMDRTMAALDRALGRVESVATVLCRGRQAGDGVSDSVA